MKKTIVINIILVICVAVMFTAHAMEGTQAADLIKETKYLKVTDAVQANNILTSDNSNYVIIDLRDKDDYIKEHIKNTFNFPYDKHIEELKSFINRDENKDKTIVLICYSGNRSSKAFEDLVISGVTNIRDISIGYEGYSKKYEGQYPVDSGDCQCTKE